MTRAADLYLYPVPLNTVWYIAIKEWPEWWVVMGLELQAAWFQVGSDIRVILWSLGAHVFIGATWSFWERGLVEHPVKLMMMSLSTWFSTDYNNAGLWLACCFRVTTLGSHSACLLPQAESLPYWKEFKCLQSATLGYWFIGKTLLVYSFAAR